MRTVYFSLLLANDSDENPVKCRLEQIAGEMKGGITFEDAQCLPNQGLRFLPCITKQTTYEMIFCAMLDYDEKNARWVQVEAAVIPPEFKGHILYIEIRKNHQLGQ